MPRLKKQAFGLPYLPFVDDRNRCITVESEIGDMKMIQLLKH